MWQSQKHRTRAVIVHELHDAIADREQATRHLDFDAYQHLTEHIDDLLLELHALIPAQRTGEP